MLFGSAIIDALTMILSGNQEDHFTFTFVPLLEIILKFAIAAVAAFAYFKRKR